MEMSCDDFIVDYANITLGCLCDENDEEMIHAFTGIRVLAKLGENEIKVFIPAEAMEMLNTVWKITDNQTLAELITEVRTLSPKLRQDCENDSLYSDELKSIAITHEIDVIRKRKETVRKVFRSNYATSKGDIIIHSFFTEYGKLNYSHIKFLNETKKDIPYISTFNKDNF